ncbi:unnamed protein product [Phytophthora fragariaefolia]|uniref:Unnamed protein product n=1 Tax=Phytophthora fragariaefolia TaxID=1490495 RepID=A0A9W6XWT1_9STRA|nr:unnamed protein product [Phytophthora fragariaefolia]
MNEVVDVLIYRSIKLSCLRSFTAPVEVVLDLQLDESRHDAREGVNSAVHDLPPDEEEVGDAQHQSVDRADRDLQRRVVAQEVATVRHGHHHERGEEDDDGLAAHGPPAHALSHAHNGLEHDPDPEADGVGGVAGRHSVAHEARAARARAVVAITQHLDQDDGVEHREDDQQQDGEHARVAARAQQRLEDDGDEHQVRHHAVDRADDLPERDAVQRHAEREELAHDPRARARAALAALRVLAPHIAALREGRAAHVVDAVVVTVGAGARAGGEQRGRAD